MKQTESLDDIRIYVDNEMYKCVRDDISKWMNIKTINVSYPRKTISYSYNPKPQIMPDQVTAYQKECIKHVEKSKIFFEIYYDFNDDSVNIDDQRK